MLRIQWRTHLIQRFEQASSYLDHHSVIYLPIRKSQKAKWWEEIWKQGTASLPNPAKSNPNQIWPNNKSNPIVKDSVKNSPHPEFWTSCLFRRSAFSYLPAYLKKAKMRRRNLEAQAPPVSLTQPSSIPTRFDQTTNQIRSLRIQWKTHLIQRLEHASRFLSHSFYLFLLMEGSQGWTKPPGGATVCSPGWSGVTAELAELALVNQVDDGTKELKSWNWKTISRWTWTSFSCLLMKMSSLKEIFRQGIGWTWTLFACPLMKRYPQQSSSFKLRT